MYVDLEVLKLNKILLNTSTSQRFLIGRRKFALSV